MNNKIMSQLQVESKKVNFEETGLSIPASVLKLPLEKQSEVYNYLIQMSESQKKAYLIAQDHLGTSFNILKSNGFIEWKNIPFKKV
jgi:competence protein ComGC